MSKGKRIKIQLAEGSIISAVVQYGSGDNITVKGADGFIHEIDRNIRNDDGAYVVLF